MIEERIYRKKEKMIKVLEIKIIKHTSDPKEFECKYCHKRFQSKSDLSVHIKSIHEKNLHQSENGNVASQTQPPKQVRLSCKTCFRYVKDENDLKFHMINEHGQKFSFFASGYKQQSTEESESEDSDSEDVTVSENISSTIFIPGKKCNECNFEGKSQSGLKLHMNTEHKLKCDKCSFRTTTKTLVNKHMKEFHIFST